MDRLNLLAVQLTKCRRHSNKLSLEGILESARILEEAKSLAGGRFGAWLTEQARMDRSTAGRHMRVARFTHGHGALMHQIASLSLAKTYALSSLDSALAVRILSGQVRFSAPLELISDVMFRQELRAMVPAPPPRHNRHHVFQAASSALGRAGREMEHASRIAKTMTAAQRRKLQLKIEALVRIVTPWKSLG